jgi:hypothetical protein
VLSGFDRLLNSLIGYVGSLGEYGGPSAVGLEDLKNIQEAIDGDPKKFSDLIDRLLENLETTRLLTVSGECARVIEALRLAFR